MGCFTVTVLDGLGFEFEFEFRYWLLFGHWVLVLSLNCLAAVVVGIPSPTKFILPNREEKAGEKVLSQHFYKNALSQRLQ